MYNYVTIVTDSKVVDIVMNRNRLEYTRGYQRYLGQIISSNGMIK